MQPLGRRKQKHFVGKINRRFGKKLLNWWENSILPFKVRDKKEADKRISEELSENTFVDTIDNSDK